MAGYKPTYGYNNNILIICLGQQTPTNSGVVTTYCVNEERNILEKTFETKNTGSIQVFDCTKCDGYTDDSVEVIVENLSINISGENNKCIENTNKTICNKLYVKDIDNEVTFNGKITIKKP